MDIKTLFAEAQDIIDRECQRNPNEDLQRQAEIVLTRHWPKLNAESDILNCLVIQASSYSVVRKYFQVLYPTDIHHFDRHFGTRFFPARAVPDYGYDQWVGIVCTWGNILLNEAGHASSDDLATLVTRLERAERGGAKNLSAYKPKPRIVLSLATALPLVKQLVLVDPAAFYKRNETLSSTHPGRAFEEAKRFSSPIKMMSTALACNFFKELGLLHYVKVDVHVKDLLGDIALNCRNNDKKMFILGWLLAREAGMAPFFLDKLLYVGGKYAKPEMRSLFQRHRGTYTEAVNRLIAQIPSYS